MKSGEMKWRRILLFVSGCFLIILTGFIFMLHVVVPQKFRQQLLQLPRGFQIQYSGIHVNLFASAISIDNVDLTIAPANAGQENQHRLHFSTLKFKDINFLKLAVSKNLSVHSIQLDSATFYLDSFLLANRDSLKIAGMELPFKELTIEQLNIPSSKIYLRGVHESKLIAAGDFALYELQNVSKNNIKWKNVSCKLSDINLPVKDQDLQIRKLFFDSRNQQLQIDSIKIFSASQLLGSLDVLRANKFNLENISDSNWTVGEIYLSHLNLTDLSMLRRLKPVLEQMPLNFKVAHFKADDLAFQNSQKNQSRGSIEFSDLQIRNDSTFSPANFRYAYVECEFSNLSIPFQTSIISAAYFYLDSKKENLKIERLRVQNADNTASTIEKVQLNNFDVRNLQNSKLIAGELNIGGIKTTGAPAELFKSTNDLSFFVKINQVKADDINIAYKNKTNSFSCLANFRFEGLRIERLDKNFTPGKLQFENMHCDLSGIRALIPGEMHNIQIDKLSMDSREKLIEIHSLKTVPQFGKIEYGRRRGVQGNWVKASVPRIKILEADIRTLFQQKLIAGKMIVSGSDVYVFRDRRLPRKLRNQKLPVEYMKSLPIDIRVNSVTIEPSRVVYEEYPNDWIHTGILRLEKMQMTLSPLINHPAAGDPQFIEMSATGSVMGSGSASAHFKMPLQSNSVYYVKGRFENLSLPTLNSTAENLGDFSIKSGLLNFLNFEFTMTTQRANGKIVGEYHNLVVDKIKIDRHDSAQKEKAGFSSFMLHHVIIPKNKDKSMPERKRTGKVDYPRDPTRFVTYYFIKSLLDGVRASFTFGFVLPK